MGVMGLTITRPSFGGNALSLVVGGRRFGLPPRTETHTIRGERGAEIAYVKLHDGSVHVLCRQGEIPLPSNLMQPIIARYFSRVTPT